MKFEGILKKVIFSGDNGYQIAAVESIIDEEEVIIVGYIQLFNEQVYIFEGEVDEHPTYGEQFKVDKYTLKTPEAGEDIINFLSSDSFKGIGKRTAKKIVDRFEDMTIEVLKNDPNKVIEELNLKKNMIMDISYTLNTLDGMDILYELLNPLGFSQFYITEIFQYIQSNNIVSISSFIKHTPYELSENIESIKFEKADAIYLYYENERDSDYRVQHAVIDIINNYCYQSGDTYISYDDLKMNSRSKLGFPIDNLDVVLEQLVENKKIFIKDNNIILTDFWEAQRQIASNVIHRLDTLNLGLDQKVVRSNIDLIEHKHNIKYSELQKEAIVNSLTNNISIITGGPGTGKTTIINAVVEIFKKIKYNDGNEVIKDIGEKVMLCAPTGRAAQRMKETTGVSAKTIHSLLEWDPYKNEFQKNNENLLVQDLIIIDEFSMVDIFLGASILRAIKPSAIVIIVGDSAQLESVNPGNVLFDLIHTKKISTVHLDTIFRQGEGSSIAKFAGEIDKGNKIEFINTEDMSLIKKNVNLLNIIKQIVDKSYESGYSDMDVQVLYPKYSGSQGIDNINEFLLCNKDKDFIEGYEDVKFYVGDKVMQLKNNYDKDIYNGDIGSIIAVFKPKNANEPALEVEFKNKKVVFSKKDLIDLKHAYAISIHKSQGSEFKVVILPITGESSAMLNKKIIYTAVTRAKDKLIVVGDLDILKENVSLDTPQRNTNLKELIHKFS